LGLTNRRGRREKEELEGGQVFPVSGTDQQRSEKEKGGGGRGGKEVINGERSERLNDIKRVPSGNTYSLCVKNQKDIKKES